MLRSPANAVRRVLMCLGVVAATGCDFRDELLHTTASLGGDTAGGRGNAEGLFINETPFRVIFTFGAYDELDRDTEPVLRQFGSNPDNPNYDVLDGNTQTGIYTLPCHRVYSIGGAGLIARVERNLDASTYDADLLVEGAYFSTAASDSLEANTPTEGQADPIDSFIGVDFECGSMVIYHFEYNDAGGDPKFVIEQSVIADTSNRG
jgi:hypothetical protein